MASRQEGETLVLDADAARAYSGNVLRLTSWAREAWGRCGNDPEMPDG